MRPITPGPSRINFSWLIPLILSLMVATPTSAEIYTWTDAEGNTVYSDQPGDKSTEVELPPLQTVPSGAPPSRFRPTTQQTDKKPAEAYHKLAISKPADDQAQWANSGQVDVVITIEPALRLNQGHYLRLSLDGTTRIDQSRKTHMTLTELDRGTHQLVVSVHDHNGKTIKTSQAITFHIHRPSLLKK